MALKDLVNRGALTCTGIGADKISGNWTDMRHWSPKPESPIQWTRRSLLNQPCPSASAVIGEALPTPTLLTLAGTDPSGYDLGPLRLVKTRK